MSGAAIVLGIEGLVLLVLALIASHLERVRLRAMGALPEKR